MKITDFMAYSDAPVLDAIGRLIARNSIITLDQIAMESGVPHRTVQRATVRLERAGLIKRQVQAYSRGYWYEVVQHDERG